MQSWVFYGKLHKFQRAHKGSRFQGLWFRVQGFGIYLVLRNVEVNEALVGCAFRVWGSRFLLGLELKKLRHKLWSCMLDKADMVFPVPLYQDSGLGESYVPIY